MKIKIPKLKRYGERIGFYYGKHIPFFYCLCGCGRRWRVNMKVKKQRHYFNRLCRWYHYRCEAQSGMYQPDEWILCEVCEEWFPIFDVLTTNETSHTCPRWLMDSGGKFKKCFAVYRGIKIKEAWDRKKASQSQK